MEFKNVLQKIERAGLSLDDKISRFYETKNENLFNECIKATVLEIVQKNRLANKIVNDTSIIKPSDNSYSPLYLSDTTAYSKLAAGSTIPDSTIYENSSPISMLKFARTIAFPYEITCHTVNEVLKYVRIVAKRFGKALDTSVITTLSEYITSNSGNLTEISDDTLTAESIFDLIGNFANVKDVVLVANGSGTYTKILNLFDGYTLDENGDAILPNGCKLVNSSLSADKIEVYAIDKEDSLSMIEESMEFKNDSLINQERIRFVFSVAFNISITNSGNAKNAVYKLSITKS